MAIFSKLGKLTKFRIPPLASQRRLATRLVYEEYGEPTKVVHKEDEKIEEPQSNEILVRMLAAPVNPVDINTIQGKYPSKPPLPAVPGNEGVGIVEKVGSEVEGLHEGDHIVPLVGNLGTWRTHALMPSNNVLKVPKNMGLIEAATLVINPCTAYRMLKDFIDLKPGDTVIQNGANSACGQNVIQICKSLGVRTVNVIRSRPDLEKVKEFLTDLGATHVLTEEEIRSTNIFGSNKLDNPKLALNCVGGKSVQGLVKYLQDGSTLVTYGGMSREPVLITTSALIFRNIKIKGFWMTRWSKENADSVEQLEMFEELISLITNKELRGPVCELVKFENYARALKNTLTAKGMVGKKFILDFSS